MGKEYSPFKMKSSPTKYYEELEMFKKFKKAKSLLAKNTSMATSNLSKAKDVVKTGVKTGVKGALGTAGAIVGALYSFGKESIKRKKAGLSGFNLPKPPPKKDFAFSGSKTKDLRSKKTKEAETKEVLKKSEPGMEHKYDWKYDTKSKKNKGFNF